MLLLVIYILDDPFHVLAAERQDPVSALPFEGFGLDLVIDVIGT
jgi:hypothetical protein